MEISSSEFGGSSDPVENPLTSYPDKAETLPPPTLTRSQQLRDAPSPPLPCNLSLGVALPVGTPVSHRLLINLLAHLHPFLPSLPAVAPQGF